MSDIVERLREEIIVDAFEQHRITDGKLADRLIRERAEAADALTAERERADKLEARVAELEKALEPFASVGDFIEIETEGFSDDDLLDLHFKDFLVERFKVGTFRAARAVKGGRDGE